MLFRSIDATGAMADGWQTFEALFGLIEPGGWYVAESAAAEALAPILRNWIDTGRKEVFNGHEGLAAAIGSIHFLRAGPGESAVAVRRRDCAPLNRS